MPYFTYVPLASETLARAEELNATFNGIQQGFGQLPAAEVLAGNMVGFAPTTGTGNDYLMDVDPAPIALTAGITVHGQAHRANDGAVTLDLNGLGAKQVRDYAGETLTEGAIPLNSIFTVRYDGSIWRLNTIVGITTPADNSVTLAKHYPFPAWSMLANASAIEGLPQYLTHSEARTFMDVARRQDPTDPYSVDPAKPGMVLGSFGLGTDAPFELSDLNDAPANGWYGFAVAANSPFSYGIVLHAQRSSTRKTQIAIQSAASSTGRMAMRTMNDTSGWSGWSEVFTQASAIDPVSESNDVPTGGLMESGSNANGSYSAWANGTLMCWSNVTLTYAETDRLAGLWVFPMRFAIPGAVVTMAQDTAGDSSYGFAPGLVAQLACSDVATISCNLSAHAVQNGNDFASGDELRDVHIMAMGRWF